jgi:hypothetical protein
MPRWQVQSPGGQTFEVEGDREPTEAELAQVLASVAPPEQDPAMGSDPEERGLYIPGVGQLPTMRQAASAVAEAAPAVGGMIGGTVGGIGGTVGGVGVGGVPGAAGGAALGAAGGEAARRLIQEAVLAEEAPTGGMEAAKDIGAAGAASAAATALGAGGLKLLSVGGRPLVRGAVAAGKELVGNAPSGTVRAAAVKGFEAAAGKKLPKIVEAKIEHMILRGAKEAGKPAVKAAVKEVRDEIPEKIVKWATENKWTRKEIIDSLKKVYGSETFSEGAAGQIVDDVAKLYGIELRQTASQAARRAGMSTNDQILKARAAQAAKAGAK